MTEATAALQQLKSRTWQRLLTRQTEIAGAILITCALVVALTCFKDIQIGWFRGDTAIFLQVTDHLAHSGVPSSGIAANVQQSIFEQHLPKMSAAEMANNGLPPPPLATVNMFSWHAYYVLYPIALLAKFLPAEPLLLATFVIAFVGLALGSYLALRREDIPPLASLMFVVVLLSHPAWWESIKFGQFYPDRLFVLAGFLLMYAVWNGRWPRWSLIALSLLCASITERGPLIAGVSVLGYVLLYWRKDNDRYFKLGLAVALLLYSFILFKFVLSNPINGGYIPFSIAGIITEFTKYPFFTQKTILMLLVDAPLLILAAFEWRALIIAIVAMIPNIIGTLGGVEKIGWSSHYPSYYFAILVWAAMVGFLALYRRYFASRKAVLLYGTVLVATFLWRCLDPYSFASLQFSPKNVANDFLLSVYPTLRANLNSAGFAYRALGDRIATAVPEGSAVSSTESGMPFVYKNRTVYFFPVGIDTADYAIVIDTVGPNGKLSYTGDVSFLGAAEQKKIDALLVKRMRRDHYDLDHPTLIPGLNLAILKRIH
jgi:hypothetical protein